MAVLYYPQQNVTGPTTGPTAVNTPAGVMNGGSITIDGTPVRVAMLALGAAVGIAALKWAGFRFNVGVS